MKSKAWTFLMLIGLLGWTGIALGKPVEKPASAPALGDPYTDTWLVVIGINDYKFAPKLNYAVADAEAVKELMMSRYRVKPDHVTTLYNENATRDKIAFVMGDALADSSRVKPTDRVIIFFAGHGAQSATERGGEPMGYLVPVNGNPKNLASTCISMREIQESARRIPARSILFLVDACYGGIAGEKPRDILVQDPKQIVQQAPNQQAIQIITAGTANQPALEAQQFGHSLFTFHLLQALEGQADKNGDGITTSRELFAFVAPQVAQVSGGRQTPQMFTLFGAGDVIFVAPEGVALPASQGAISTRAKLMIESNPPGAEIKINNQKRGTTPQSGIDLDPGKYDVEISKKGFRTQHKVIELAPGQVDSINLTLQKKSAWENYRPYVYAGAGVLAVTIGILASQPASTSDSGGGKGTGSIIIDGSPP